jgi:hypothetical protein
VLRKTHMPAVLLEAGSIVHREEEVALTSPDRLAIVGGAVAEAVDEFCASRSARLADRVRRAPVAAAPTPVVRSSAAAAPVVRSIAAPQQASSVKQR